MYPKAALIAYECETADFSHPQNYLELRPINERGRMGAGIPVTYEFMNSLTESYTEGMNGTPHGRIPPNMLLCDPRKGHEKYIWYNPPQKRKMYFQSCLHITDGTFNVPGIIYVVEQESMDVHAFKGTGSPGTDGALPGTLLQCNRSGCLSGELVTGKNRWTPIFPASRNTGRNVSGLASSRIWEAAGTRHAATWFP